MMDYRVFAGLGALALCLVLAACSPVRLLNTATPSFNYKQKQTIAFGEGERQSMDIYRAKSPKEDAPVLVFFYGGGWTWGEKAQYKFVGDAFASAGYDVVIPDYRLYPKVKYPAFVEDAAHAVARVAQEFPDRKIVLMGHSAGAYNGMMLTLDPHWLADVGVDRDQVIAGMVGLSGPYGATPMTDKPYISIFPKRMTGDDGPVNIASAGDPPVLLITGSDDETVDPKNTTELARILRENGVDVTEHVYPELTHIDTARVLSRFFDGDAPQKGDILAWLEGVSG
ncbi:MAG: esterase [Hirschia sp.]|nr:esterase [Hirschia sp.]MBF19683.1 esterase [Hirschia sp.]